MLPRTFIIRLKRRLSARCLVLSLGLLWVTTFIAARFLQYDISLIGTDWSIDLGALRSYHNLACIQPKLDPFSPAMAATYEKLAPLKCREEGKFTDQWVLLKQGVVQWNAEAVRIKGKFTCEGVEIMRNENDEDIYNGETVKLYEGLQLRSDVWEVSCKSEKGEVWKAVIRTIAAKPKQTAGGEKLDVVIILIDSLSHAAWQRYMPNTLRYFTENMGGIVMEGYNVVGDGTPQNVMPMMAGKNEFEMPEMRRNMPGSIRTDSWPLLFKNFSAAGYRTLFDEDKPMFTCFSYRFTGFQYPPADHYGRVYQLAAVRSKKVWEVMGWVMDFCDKALTRTAEVLGWINEFQLSYPTTPTMSWSLLSDVTHDSNAYAQHMDPDVLQYLRTLKADGRLEKTVVILQSDHGARFSSVRNTLQGKLEERLTFMGFYFPASFEAANPEEIKTLRRNVPRLSTPYDVHETLLHFLELQGLAAGAQVSRRPPKGSIKKRSQSLFQEIPEKRTCEAAGIEPHWCACSSWKTEDPVSASSTEVARAVLEAINYFVSDVKDLCQEWRQTKIFSISSLLPNADMLKFRATNDKDGFKADMSDNMKANQVIYEINVETDHGATFSATAKRDSTSGAVSVDPRSVQRTSKYGTQPWCIVESHQQLRPFCYCKEQKRQ